MMFKLQTKDWASKPWRDLRDGGRTFETETAAWNCIAATYSIFPEAERIPYAKRFYRVVAATGAGR